MTLTLQQSKFYRRWRETAPLVEKSVFWAYLALLLCVPMPHGSVSSGVWSVMEIWIFTLAAAWLWAWLGGGARITPVFRKAWPILIIWALWLGLIALQFTPLPFSWVAWLSPEAARLQEFANPDLATLSVDRHSTQVGFLTSLGYVLLFTLTFLIADTRNRLRMVAYTLVISGLLQAVFGTLPVLLSHFEITRASGRFVNPNHLAGYLELCLSVGIGMLIAWSAGERPPTWRLRMIRLLRWLESPVVYVRLALITMVIALVMTRSRMGNTAFIASLIIAGVLTLLISRQPKRSLVALVVSLIVIDLVVIGNWFGLNRVIERLEATDVAREESRLMPVQESRDYRRDYPWFGSGLGSYPMAYYRYESGPARGHKVHAHNDHAQFLYETGRIGGGILAVAALSTYFVSLAALYVRHRSWNRGLAFAVLMAMTALMIHSAADFNLQIHSNALTFMTILALGWIARYLPSTRGHPHRRLSAPVVSGGWSTLAVLGMIGTLSLVGYRIGEIGYSDSIVGDTSDRLARADHTKASGRENPLEDLEARLRRALGHDPTNPKILRLMGHLSDRKATMTAEENRSMELRQEALQYRWRSAAIRPVAPFIWVDILSSKNQLSAYDPVFFEALAKAALLAPWERTVQYWIVDIGLASPWYRLSPDAQQRIIETIERGMVDQVTDIGALITRHRREWVVCAYSQTETMSTYCDKFSSRVADNSGPSTPQPLVH